MMMPAAPPWMAAPRAVSIPAPAKSECEAPIVPWVPARAPSEAPAYRIAIPDRSNPRRIIVAVTVYDDTVFDFCSHIARSVTVVDYILVRPVHMNISEIVERRTGRDRVNHGWDRIGDSPRTID